MHFRSHKKSDSLEKPIREFLTLPGPGLVTCDDDIGQAILAFVVEGFGIVRNGPNVLNNNVGEGNVATFLTQNSRVDFDLSAGDNEWTLAAG